MYRPRPLVVNKTGFNLEIFHFTISEKLFIMRCDKQIIHHWSEPFFIFVPEDNRIVNQYFFQKQFSWRK